MRCSVQSFSRVRLCDPMDYSTPGFPVHHQLPEFYSNSRPSSQWCHATISSSVIHSSSCLQSFPAIRVFSKELFLRIRWPKYWSFSFSISPFKLKTLKKKKFRSFFSFFNVVAFAHIKVKRWFWFYKDDTHALRIFKDSANFRSDVLFSDCVLIFYMGSMVASLTTYYQPARHA